MSLVVWDGDTVGVSRSPPHGVDIENTIGINVEGDLNLRDTTWRCMDPSQLKLAEQIFVFSLRLE